MSNIGGTSADSGMVRVMGMVGVALLLLAICIGLTANILGGDEDGASDDAVMRNALIQRIEPVGRVRTTADAPAPVEAVADAGGAMKSGQELVDGACAACHVAGVAGAPLLDDEAAWAERREAGLDALVASVINGKGSMPARGGSTYTDEEIRVAVQHIALFEEEVAPAEDSAAAAPAEATDAAAEEATAEVTPEPLEADGVEAAKEVVAEPVADGEGQADTLADEALVDSVTDATPAVAAGALVVGQAPDTLPDHVKTTVDGVCSGCHIAGVAGAPKTGDQAAWQERADKGLEALVASVTNGMGAMPPRGGSTLTDAEIPIAIQYLMSK